MVAGMSKKISCRPLKLNGEEIVPKSAEKLPLLIEIVFCDGVQAVLSDIAPMNAPLVVKYPWWLTVSFGELP
jgi:hypothetical protein